jgi:thioredoxin reductase
MMDIFDVIIVGGGPAGLNAAVVLGRCRRRVLVFDNQQYRNRWSHGVHNYLTQDDILPADFINLCHKEIYKYGVKLVYKKVIRARKDEKGLFLVKDEEGNSYHSRKLLIATGVQDNIPPIPGLIELYGHSVFHCPYCDGWEVKDQRLAVYAKNKDGSELALALRTWSKDVVLLTDGEMKLKPKQKEKLEAKGIPVIKKKIKELVGENGKLQQVVFKHGDMLERDALFFVNGFNQQCDLAEVFGCEMSHKGVVITNSKQQTTIKGLYVAGDADMDVQFVVVAAAEGAKAGVIINKELQKEKGK